MTLTINDNLPAGSPLEWVSDNSNVTIVQNVETRVDFPKFDGGWAPFDKSITGVLPLGMEYIQDDDGDYIQGIPGVLGFYRIHYTVRDEATENITGHYLSRTLVYEVTEDNRSIPRSLSIVDQGTTNLPVAGLAIGLTAVLESELSGETITSLSWVLKQGTGATLTPAAVGNTATLTLPNTTGTRVVVDCEATVSGDDSIVIDSEDYSVTTVSDDGTALIATLSGNSLIRSSQVTSLYTMSFTNLQLNVPSYQWQVDGVNVTALVMPLLH